MTSTISVTRMKNSKLIIDEKYLLCICKKSEICSCNWFYLGIEFYLFVSHGGMNYRGSICKFTRGSSVFHTSMRNKQVEFNPYIYTLSKLYRFWLRNIRFLIQNTRSLFYGGHYSSLPRLMLLHGKMNVNIFLMFIVTENTGSVNITT